MHRELEKCEKALNEYLEIKKGIFPRFYFVSNAALLDILSNGNNPPKIMPHIGSVFDGIGDLDLCQSENQIKMALDDSNGCFRTSFFLSSFLLYLIIHCSLCCQRRWERTSAASGSSEGDDFQGQRDGSVQDLV